MKRTAQPVKRNDNSVVDRLDMVVTYEQRKEIMAQPVTLNGKPATVSGGMTKFAVIRQLGGGLSFEWSWSAVARIVKNKGGEFKA